MSRKRTIPSYVYEDTTDPNVKRFVDRNGNWTHYYLVKEKKFVKAVNHILKLGYAKSEYFYTWLKNTTAEEAERRLKNGGEEGTRTHIAIRDLAAGLKVTMSTRIYDDRTGKQEMLTNDEWDNLEAYTQFVKDYKQELVGEEKAVYSLKHEYAGTFDRLCVITVPEGDKKFPKKAHGKKVLVLLDWKTSGGIWDEYHAQLAAYWQSIKEHGHYKRFTDFYKANGGCYGMIVRLGTRHKCGYEVQVFTEDDMKTNFIHFSNAQNIADKYEPEFNPEVREIPMDFYLPLKKAKMPAVVKEKRSKISEKVNKKTNKLKKDLEKKVKGIQAKRNKLLKSNAKRKHNIV